MKKMLFLILFLSFFYFWNASAEKCILVFNWVDNFSDEKIFDFCEKNEEIYNITVLDENFNLVWYTNKISEKNNILSDSSFEKEDKIYKKIFLNWEKKFEYFYFSWDNLVSFSNFLNYWNHITYQISLYDWWKILEKNLGKVWFYIDGVKVFSGFDYSVWIDFLEKNKLKLDFNQKLSLLEKEKIDLSLKKYFEKSKDNTKQENEKILKSFEKYLDYLFLKKELKDFSDSEIKEILVFHYIYTELFIKNLLEK